MVRPEVKVFCDLSIVGSPTNFWKIIKQDYAIDEVWINTPEGIFMIMYFDEKGKKKCLETLNNLPEQVDFPDFEGFRVTKYFIKDLIW